MTCSEQYSRIYKRSAERYLEQLRAVLRSRLGTVPRENLQEIIDAGVAPGFDVEAAVRAASSTGELFMGMASGPYMLVLKADDPEAFLRYVRQNPAPEVSIRWSGENRETWYVVPRFEVQGFRLTFRLPKRLAAWIFTSRNSRVAALTAKSEFFASITLYRHSEEGDQLIRLRYEARALDSVIG
jgi:hypothetical protein